jgi:hypothetical protein
MSSASRKSQALTDARLDFASKRSQTLGLFGALFSVVTISVGFAIAALVNINKIADPSLAQAQQYITIGMAFNVVAWILMLIGVGISANPNRTRAASALALLAFLFLVTGSALLLVAATGLDRVLLRVIYIFSLTAGVLGIIGSAIQLTQGISLIRTVTSITKLGTGMVEDAVGGTARVIGSVARV